MSNQRRREHGILGFKNANFSGPYQLNFIVSFFCVSGCKTCNIWKMGGEAKKGELTLNEIEEVSRNSPDFRWIRFTGGEPFMRTDLEGIVRAFH
jgi:molybdenum cofactor biosynthesis enzyme MoaA